MNKVVYPNINCANVFDTCLLSVSNNNQAYINKLQGIAGIVAQEWKFLMLTVHLRLFIYLNLVLLECLSK